MTSDHDLPSASISYSCACESKVGLSCSVKCPPGVTAQCHIHHNTDACVCTC